MTRLHDENASFRHGDSPVQRYRGEQPYVGDPSFGDFDDAQEPNRRVLSQMVGNGYQEGTAAIVDLEAVIQFHRGELARATHLIGGADTVFATIGAIRWPEQIYTVEPVLAATRKEFGDAEFERLLSEGRASSLEALIELASAHALALFGRLNYESRNPPQ